MKSKNEAHQGGVTSVLSTSIKPARGPTFLFFFITYHHHSITLSTRPTSTLPACDNRAARLKQPPTGGRTGSRGNRPTLTASPRLESGSDRRDRIVQAGAWPPPTSRQPCTCVVAGVPWPMSARLFVVGERTDGRRKRKRHPCYRMHISASKQISFCYRLHRALSI